VRQLRLNRGMVLEVSGARLFEPINEIKRKTYCQV
jgi:hypothetical protein